MCCSARRARLVTQISQGYRAVDDQWSALRTNVDGMVTDLNSAASEVADLNGRIRSTLAAGGSANELMDRRDLLTAKIANLAGGVVRPLDDGTVDVLIGGNAHRLRHHVQRRAGGRRPAARAMPPPIPCGSSGRTARERPSRWRAAPSRALSPRSRRPTHPEPAACSPRPQPATTRSR